MKTLREYIDQLDEISRRDFLKGAGAAAGLAAIGKAGAQGNDWEYSRNALGSPKLGPSKQQVNVDGIWKNIEDVDRETLSRIYRQEFDAVWKAKHGYTPSDQEYDQYRKTQRAAKDRALKDLIRQDASGPAGIPGGMNNSYGATLRACIQAGVAFPPRPRTGSENPTAHFRISLDDGTGLVDGVTLIKSSGNNNFDRAVKTGILRCNPLPKPPKSPDGKYPPYIDINYKMYD
jgi:colicin import membrane protein